MFRGAAAHSDINDRGEVVFAGIVPTSQGISGALGTGVFAATKDGQITPVVAPGDPAPGGGTFDFAWLPSVNRSGDIAFGAHVHGEECITSLPQTVQIHCDESVYVKRATTGKVVPVVHQGDPAPAGGAFRSARAPVINDRGEVLFAGDLTPAPGRDESLGVYRWAAGKITPLAVPGQEMPGGGHYVTTSTFPDGNWDLNGTGNATFTAMLDSFSFDPSFGDLIQDTGLYTWSDGKLDVVARTGTEVPELGTVIKLMPPLFGGLPYGGPALNDAGTVLFQATFRLQSNPGLLYGALITARPKWTNAHRGWQLDSGCALFDPWPRVR